MAHDSACRHPSLFARCVVLGGAWLAVLMLCLSSGTSGVADRVPDALPSCPGVQSRIPSDYYKKGESFLHPANRNLDVAYGCFQAAERLEPNSPVPYIYLSLVPEIKKDNAGALRHIQQALQIAPEWNEANLKLANIRRNQGRDQEALAAYKTALKSAPGEHRALNALGQLCSHMGLIDDAVHYYKEDVRHNPKDMESYVNLAIILKDLGNEEEAINLYKEALVLEPNSPHVWYNYGIVLSGQGQDEKAMEFMQKAIDVSNGTFPEAYHQKGLHLMKVGRIHDAAEAIEQARALAPDNAMYLNSLAIVMGTIKDHTHLKKALALYDQAINANPRWAVAHTNRGNVLKDMGDIDGALKSIERALQLDETDYSTHCHYADTLKEVQRVDDAISHYQRALQLNPDYHPGKCNMIYNKQFTADWRNRTELFDDLTKIISRELEEPLYVSSHECVQPFMALAYPLGPEIVYGLSARHARKGFLVAQTFKLPPFRYSALPKLGKRRLNVGFMSSDFYDHPVSKHLLNMFGMFDRGTTSVTCFATSKSDRSVWRVKIEKEVETFRDLHDLGFAEIAQVVNRMRTDMLFNLNGYTLGEANEVFALRPAPVQVLFFGYLSTSASTYIDYVVSDRITSPPEFRSDYSERLAYMPNTFFGNNYLEAFSRVVFDDDWVIERGDYGIPEDKFVFCNFNQAYKTDPQSFFAWMRILKRVPNSVIWLMRIPPSFEAHLRREAKQVGIRDEQIYFTNIFPTELHHKIKSTADLYLDNMEVNGHTNDLDVLWAGVPMVTILGRKMCSRVGGSVANAIGCPEMVANSLQQYEDMAVDFAMNSDKVKVIAEKVRRKRLDSPLFDTSRWVRDFDRVLRELAEVLHSNGSPMHVAVRE